jgi:hypothetical protein
MLPGDRRSAWDAWVLPDPRVTHLWDEQHVAGRWFARYLDRAATTRDVFWDGYLLYGPEATWESAPAPLIGSSTGTVIGSRAALRKQLLPFLER